LDQHEQRPIARKHPIGTACRIGPQWPKTRV
jgi:hypothetical protein